MSKHDHPAPLPTCEHETLAFCKRCNVVHCLKCEREFTPKVVFLPTVWTSGSVHQYQYPQGELSYTNSEAAQTHILNQLPRCDHDRR